MLGNQLNWFWPQNRPVCDHCGPRRAGHTLLPTVSDGLVVAHVVKYCARNISSGTPALRTTSGNLRYNKRKNKNDQKNYTFRPIHVWCAEMILRTSTVQSAYGTVQPRLEALGKSASLLELSQQQPRTSAAIYIRRCVLCTRKTIVIQLMDGKARQQVKGVVVVIGLV